MIETWVPVIGYEGLYEVSNLGRVKSLNRHNGIRPILERIMKQSIDSRGYLSVRISKDFKTKSRNVHKIVFESFNKRKTAEKMVVDHKDENKKNNRLDNLQEITHRLNVSKSKKTQNVSLFKRTGRYTTTIFIGKNIRLGYFDTEDQARSFYALAVQNINLFNGDVAKFKNQLKALVS